MISEGEGGPAPPQIIENPFKRIEIIRKPMKTHQNWDTG
jgi:hypothetical protein